MYEGQNQRVDIWRILMALIFPPLAVLDKGCGTTSLVFLLTMFGWFPGVVLALFIITSDQPLRRSRPKERRFIEIPGGELTIVNDRHMVETPVYHEEKEKRKGSFIHLEDGEVAEVIEDDGAPLEKRKREL
jgi:uncharacterized membrane protein YqaE (UPF0057 family)